MRLFPRKRVRKPLRHWNREAGKTRANSSPVLRKEKFRKAKGSRSILFAPYSKYIVVSVSPKNDKRGLARSDKIIPIFLVTWKEPLCGILGAGKRVTPSVLVIKFLDAPRLHLRGIFLAFPFRGVLHGLRPQVGLFCLSAVVVFGFGNKVFDPYFRSVHFNASPCRIFPLSRYYWFGEVLSKIQARFFARCPAEFR